MAIISQQLVPGTLTAAQYSGAVVPVVRTTVPSAAVGSDVFLHSGPGRLHCIIPTGAAVLSLSGVPVNVYDGAAAVSGGPLSTSGHVPLGTVGGPFGASGQFTQPGVAVVYNVPFNSGLIFNSRSGQSAVTIVWTSGNGGV